MYQLPPSDIKIATAISNQEFEAFVISTALKNNWQIVARTFDMNDLNLQNANILFLAKGVSVPEFNGRIIELEGNEREEDLVQLISKPKQSQNEIADLVAGSGKIISITGLNGGVGTTQISINLGFELAELNQDIHLLDYMNPRPMIAPYLALRELVSKPNKLLPKLLISQSNDADLGNYHRFVQDQINRGVHSVIDNGIKKPKSISTHNLFVARLDLSGFNSIGEKLKKREFPANSWLLLNQSVKSPLEKRLTSQLISMLQGSPIKRIRTLPQDFKAFSEAQNCNGALMECAGRSGIRRAILELARELI